MDAYPVPSQLHWVLSAAQKAIKSRQPAVEETVRKLQLEFPEAMPEELARTLNNLGRLQQTTGRAAEALECHSAARDLRRAIVSANPNDLDARSLLGSSYNNLGLTYMDLGRPAEAIEAFRQGIERGIGIVPVPGPTAFVAALTASGLPTDEFYFGGFLPARAHARRQRLEAVRDLRATLVFY